MGGGHSSAQPRKPSPAPVAKRVTYSRATGCGHGVKVRTQGNGIRDYRAGLSRTESSVSEQVFLPERDELWNASPPQPIPGSGSASAATVTQPTLSMLGGQAAATIYRPREEGPGKLGSGSLCTRLSSVDPAPSHCQGLLKTDFKFDPSSLRINRNLNYIQVGFRKESWSPTGCSTRACLQTRPGVLAQPATSGAPEAPTHPKA